jgi:RNA:NAD 2'-phosphotransferase (TPT1/KptA family)
LIARNTFPGGGLSVEFITNLNYGDAGKHFKGPLGPLHEYLFILALIRTDKKQRFHVVMVEAPGRHLPVVVACAAQGHSHDIPGNISYLTRVMPEQAEELGVVFHGTSRSNSHLIGRSGLLRTMGRTHVHFYSTHEMATRDIKISDLKPSSQQVCYIFKGIKKWIEEGHIILRAPNGVILSPMDIPVQRPGEPNGYIEMSTRFPIPMVYNRRWHPPTGESRPSSSAKGPPARMPGDRHASTGSSSSQAPSQEPRYKAPPPGYPKPPAEKRYQDPPASKPMPKPTSSPFPTEHSHVPKTGAQSAPATPPKRPPPPPPKAAPPKRVPTSQGGPIDWEEETRPTGVFAHEVFVDKFNDKCNKYYFWQTLTGLQKQLLSQTGIETEEQWHCHPMSNVIHALLARIWYCSKYKLLHGNRPKMDMFADEDGMRDSSIDVTLNSTYLDGCLDALEASTQAMLMKGLEHFRRAEITRENLSRLPMKEFPFLLYLMGSMKQKNHDQPEIFVRYIYFLNEQVGWETQFGPLRLYISEDTQPMSDEEHDAIQEWKFKRGEIPCPHYRARPIEVDGDEEKPLLSGNDSELIWLDDNLKPIVEEQSLSKMDEILNPFGVDYDPDEDQMESPPLAILDVEPPRMEFPLPPRTTAAPKRPPPPELIVGTPEFYSAIERYTRRKLERERERQIPKPGSEVLDLVHVGFAHDTSFNVGIDLNLQNLLLRMMTTSLSPGEQMENLRQYLEIDKISEQILALEDAVPTDTDIIMRQHDEMPLKGDEVPDFPVADLSQDQLEEKVQEIKDRDEKANSTQDMTDFLRDHAWAQDQDTRTAQYMLARIVQPGECPHPHSNLHPRRFWHNVSSASLFSGVVAEDERMREEIQKRPEDGHILGFDDIRCVDDNDKPLDPKVVLEEAETRTKHLKEIPQEPTEQVLEAEKEFYRGINDKMGAFPYFDRTRQNTLGPEGIPSWTTQLGILVANFGPITRSHIKKVTEYKEVPSRETVSDDMWNRNRFIDYLTASGVHMIGLVEACDVGSSEESRGTIAQRGFSLSFSKDNWLMLGVRKVNRYNEDSVPIVLLVDSHRLSNEDSLPEKYRTPRDVRYAIWELDMGIDSKRTSQYKRDRYITRAGIQKVRILLYHVHNASATLHAAATVSSLQFMWRDIVEYEVDIIAGDANQAAYWYRKDKQNIMDPRKCAVTSVGRMYQKILNEHICKSLLSDHYLLSIQFLTNNATKKLGEFMKNCTESLQQTGHVPAELTEGLDCMVFGVLSWGHNTVQNLPRFQRDTAASSGQEISINTKAADFIMNLSEHPLRFTCHHFWLGTTDETWHRPIQVYIRSKNSVRVKKNVNKIKANLERRGIHFDASRHPSPTDAEVGFRQRPINMLTIHSHGSKEVLTSDQPEEQQGTYRGWPSSSWYGGSSSSKAWWREQ